MPGDCYRSDLARSEGSRPTPATTQFGHDQWCRTPCEAGCPPPSGASDFASALGAPEVLVTRALRDSRSPTVASRFWLRLLAMDAELEPDGNLAALVSALDNPGEATPAEQPRPIPSAEQRPRIISVTDVDRLKADPFEFYAKAILKLRRLEALDLDPTAAWKGTAVHKVLELWLQEDECAPEKLIPRAEALLRGDAVHPLLRALWQPRLMEAIRWIEEQVEQDRRQRQDDPWSESRGRRSDRRIRTPDRIDRHARGGRSLFIAGRWPCAVCSSMRRVPKARRSVAATFWYRRATSATARSYVFCFRSSSRPTSQ